MEDKESISIIIKEMLEEKLSLDNNMRQWVNTSMYGQFRDDFIFMDIGNPNSEWNKDKEPIVPSKSIMKHSI